jgi:hypothetical protein
MVRFLWRLCSMSNGLSHSYDTLMHDNGTSLLRKSDMYVRWFVVYQRHNQIRNVCVCYLFVFYRIIYTAYS